MIIEENSNVVFNDNVAYMNSGGAMYIHEDSTVTIGGNSVVTFYHNLTFKNGGAVHINKQSIIILEGNSTVTFYDNRVHSNCGAMNINFDSSLTSKNNLTLSFRFNYAYNGGALCVHEYSTVTFEENSTVIFYDNEAFVSGGAVHVKFCSTVELKGNSTVMFWSSRAIINGGAVFINFDSVVQFKGTSMVTFYNNTTNEKGGALYIGDHCISKSQDNCILIFYYNMAELGGSVFIEQYADVTIGGNSSIKFSNNAALWDGGAIYLNDHSNFTQCIISNVTFYYNTARDYGGGIYALIKGSSIIFNSSNVHFKDNTAGLMQQSVYINVPESYDTVCLNQSVYIPSKNSFPLVTSPTKLVLNYPAICISGSNSVCDTYFVNNVMLGQQITLSGCVYDYYNQETEAAQFSITGMNNQNYSISNGSEYILVSCNQTTQGISVIGNLPSNSSYNYSINISLDVARMSETKVVSVNLTIELSQCHPGFWYFSTSKKCECYNTKNIISCFGGNSTIKRGYWFGLVNGKPTVTSKSCPNEYCNFTCCEIINGMYHLSPDRGDQCRPHRSGTACGNCEKGYTLSFDSPDCIKERSYQTALVVVFSLLYWVAIVVTVFVITHFKVTIGSLSGIIYYYSVMDILINNQIDISNGLYRTISILSGLAKLTPQFLGRLYLVTGMSGIDQQFIHYAQPLAVLLILIMISMLARSSHRFSLFVSRGIIQFICFLLLLSYTSVVTTSLLLMQPMEFEDIDKIYTYLSPDFHKRHLAYTIVAVILTILIAIGFPLLLLTEPFLNSKVNFVKVKPILDQFQGCYKDKYRLFSGYYMICRLVIISFVINNSGDFTTQYLLISSCALMQLIHVLVRPYASTIHNVFDGIILQLICRI